MQTFLGMTGMSGMSGMLPAAAASPPAASPSLVSKNLLQGVGAQRGDGDGYTAAAAISKYLFQGVG